MSPLSQQWTEKLADWRRSGLSMAAWCRQNDEGYYRFLYWRKRLQPEQPEVINVNYFSGSATIKIPVS
ncbi:IS66 family insertion sequence element accessory protein TnpA [Geoalkalibacter subterraneus]|uniref:Transposase n=1 Tax=Geoalkalibacter subterraneus TaxID=483547 RepID=A0A0B5FHC8_9BACT|nr:hypothetical protein [Geoalkalibacter subterraneus]AJF06783.1 hypothetical protein GSUB_09815 [Geoalkalibacter subterraneus]